MKQVYLDYASTTPVDPAVIAALNPLLADTFGNPSSPHFYGQQARKAVEDARDILAKSIGGYSDEIVFTSGGTESNNLAILGVAKSLKDRGNHIIVSKSDHHSVIRPAEELKSLGFHVTWLDVDRFGQVNPDDVEKNITSKTILVAVMHASNEIGTIQPVGKIGKITRSKKVYFLVDAVQSLGHIPVNVNDLNCDLLSLSGHKFYGIKGAGALYIRKGTWLSSCLLGGDQERSRRASTHNVPGIAAMGLALSICLKKMPEEMNVQTELRNRLIEYVRSNIEGAFVNGHPDERLPNNAHFSFTGLDGESLLLSLDTHGFCASMGSACTSGSLTPSHVLTAIGLSDPLALGSLRVTIGRWTTNEDISAFCEQLKKSVNQLRK
jgi:cysteine desulfurase